MIHREGNTYKHLEVYMDVVRLEITVLTPNTIFHYEELLKRGKKQTELDVLNCIHFVHSECSQKILMLPDHLWKLCHLFCLLVWLFIYLFVSCVSSNSMIESTGSASILPCIPNYSLVWVMLNYRLNSFVQCPLYGAHVGSLACFALWRIFSQPFARYQGFRYNSSAWHLWVNRSLNPHLVYKYREH